MATFSGRGDGTGVKNPRLKSPFPDIEPRFCGAFFYADADALYAFKSRGFGGEVGAYIDNNNEKVLQAETYKSSPAVLQQQLADCLRGCFKDVVYPCATPSLFAFFPVAGL